MKSIRLFRQIFPAFVLASALVLSGCQTKESASSAPATVMDFSQYPKESALLPGKGPITTWDGFWKIWTQRHADWQKTADSDKHAVVFLGDSITQGWRTLSNDFSNLHVANRGISGDTTRGVLYRLPEVVDLSPEAVVLLIGTNDLGLGADPADVAGNIHDILRGLRKSNRRMPIILCLVMPRADRNLHLEEKIKQLNRLIAEAAKDVPRVTLCDTWTMYADANGDCSRAEFPDLLHPNAVGYAKWTAELKPILAKLKIETKKMN